MVACDKPRNMSAKEMGEMQSGSALFAEFHSCDVERQEGTTRCVVFGDVPTRFVGCGRSLPLIFKEICQTPCLAETIASEMTLGESIERDLKSAEACPFGFFIPKSSGWLFSGECIGRHLRVQGGGKVGGTFCCMRKSKWRSGTGGVHGPCSEAGGKEVFDWNTGVILMRS